MSQNKTLVLAEKPSVGKDIARVLKCKNGQNGYLENERYIVTWALGHLVSLADPEAYGEKYQSWNMESLPMLPEHMKLTVLKGSGKQYKIVSSLLGRSDVKDIVIATDAGREGELVARWILDKAHCKKPIKRLWISSVTDKAISEGFKHLKPGAEFDNLYRAAQCRAEGDWLVGLNITRALTVKYNAQLSAGRVQSATLNMIVQREEAIKNFKPVPYYNLQVKTPQFTLTWQGQHGKNINSKETAEKILQKLKGKSAVIRDISKKPKKSYSPGLYDLTELQRDANRLFGMSPKETLNIMQRLYENHKILTYPRTDSKYLTQDIVPTLSERLKTISIGPYKSAVSEILKLGIHTNKSFVDDHKVSDHHAIIPTEQRVILANLSTDERRIYDLVIKRFLSVFLPPYEYLLTTVTADIAGEALTAKGREIVTLGYKKVYENQSEEEDEEDNEDQKLPSLKKGDSLPVSQVVLKELETTPPARFTEATLLSAMENPQKVVKVDAMAAKTLGETGGIGTVATRADIIEKLYKMFVIEKKGNSLYPTSKGRQLIDLVPPDLKSPLMTAKWERQLELISKGKSDPNAFITDIKAYTTELVNDVKSSNEKFVHDNKSGQKCPECGKNLLEVKGKYGMMLVCQDRACGYRENVSKNTNIRCPECHVRLEIRGKGDGAIYFCKRCGFREKVSSFNKKHFDGNRKNNKREAQNIMRKMKKENQEAVNNPFAEALAKLKDSE
ncbi:DNA topoisomerase III [Eubacterium sp. 1001713B170207_170306_E7]|uniref:DNA topoisomerase III n=1 Tax=Eubacterium sp. 1001713B170207_170306_E7 TaxID=2787097 RepID=UPI00189B5D8A|nr:DNA topoisomerase III [Eubacterium sp. 1001713B170207_170306_E7]